MDLQIRVLRVEKIPNDFVVNFQMRHPQQELAVNMLCGVLAVRTGRIMQTTIHRR